jgi:hypothetical protein
MKTKTSFTPHLAQGMRVCTACGKNNLLRVLLVPSLSLTTRAVASVMALPSSSGIRGAQPSSKRAHPWSFLSVSSEYAIGRVSHVVVEEAPDVVLCMFLINATTAVVLFDSGALHSFISVAYVEKHNLPISLLK